MMSGQVKGVIFDLDGTLVDSQLDFARIRQETGFPEDIGLLEHLDTLHDAAEITRAEAIIHRHEAAGAAAAVFMPGARSLLQQLTDRSVPTGIVTRNSRQSAGQTLRKLAIHCDILIAREDAPAKPEPAGLLAISSRWKIPPAQLVYVGDFLFDLQAANRAGMLACYYDGNASGKWTDHADIVINHFDELAALLF